MLGIGKDCIGVRLIFGIWIIKVWLIFVISVCLVEDVYFIRFLYVWCICDLIYKRRFVN